MSSTAAIAASGMGAALSTLRSAAHNVANANTAGFRRETVHQRTAVGGGVAVDVRPAGQAGHALERDVVAQRLAMNAFLANLAVFRASDAMAGSLLSLRV